MKKLLCLLLACVMLVSLCACKSKEAKAVEKLISTLPETTIESGAAIAEARAAYNALTASDKGEIKNIGALEEAENEFQELYEEKYYNFVNRLIDLNNDCSQIASPIGLLWNFWGGDNVGTAVGCILRLDSEESFNKMKENGDNWELTASFAVPAFETDRIKYKDKSDVLHFFEHKGNRVDCLEPVLNKCYEFNKIYRALEEKTMVLGDEIRKFKDAQSDEKHIKEVETLNEWFIQMSLFSDLALNPSGSLRDYIDKMTEYRESTKYYMTIVDSYY